MSLKVVWDLPVWLRVMPDRGREGKGWSEGMETTCPGHYPLLLFSRLLPMLKVVE